MKEFTQEEINKYEKIINSIFDPLTEEEYNGLKNKIKTDNKITRSFIEWEETGIRIDGRNLGNIVSELNKEGLSLSPDTIKLSFDSIEEVVLWMKKHRFMQRKSIKDRNKLIIEDFKRLNDLTKKDAIKELQKVYGLSEKQFKRILPKKKREKRDICPSLQDSDLKGNNINEEKSDEGIAVQEVKKSAHSDLQKDTTSPEGTQITDIEDEVKTDEEPKPKPDPALTQPPTQHSEFKSGEELKDETKAVDLAVNFLKERKFLIYLNKAEAVNDLSNSEEFEMVLSSKGLSLTNCASYLENQGYHLIQTTEEGIEFVKARGYFVSKTPNDDIFAVSKDEALSKLRAELNGTVFAITKSNAITKLKDKYVMIPIENINDIEAYKAQVIKDAIDEGKVFSNIIEIKNQND